MKEAGMPVEVIPEPLADGFLKAVSLLKEFELDQLAEQVSQLSEKAASRDLHIAFCGHFSAGKSTLVNTLLGTDVLPSSPIPTTSNVVEVRAGDAEAVVTLRSGEKLQFPIEDHLEKLKHYCAGEEGVKGITLYYPTDFLPPHTAIMDTPGIDSTDEVHQLATESVIYLADVIFYIMDYNHVQSELNFTFAKELQDRGKNLYLIVNQIDKHVEFELDFESYQEGVADAFAGWGVTPKRIFYTTLREPDHLYNQFEELKECLEGLFANRETIVQTGLMKEGREIVKRARQQLLAKQSEVRAELEYKLSETADLEFNQAEINRILKERAVRIESNQQKLQSLEDKALQAIRDARLLNFSLTELGADYLESLAPNFKMGWFTTEAKRIQEREARLNRFMEAFKSEINSQLVWVVRELLVKEADQLELPAETFRKAVREEVFEVTPDFIQSLIKSGAGGREYVYRFREDVANSIKEAYRRQVLQHLSVLKDACSQEELELTQQEETRINELSEAVEIQKQVAELDAEIEHKTQLLGSLIGVTH